jgi:hypothetical protein
LACVGGTYEKGVSKTLFGAEEAAAAAAAADAPAALDPAAPDVSAAIERSSVKHVSWTFVAVLSPPWWGLSFALIIKI